MDSRYLKINRETFLVLGKRVHPGSREHFVNVWRRDRLCGERIRGIRAPRCDDNGSPFAGSGRVSTMTGGSANRLRATSAITIRPSPSFARGPLTKPATMIAVIVPKCLMVGKWMIIVEELPRSVHGYVVLRHSFLDGWGQEIGHEEAEDLVFRTAMAPVFLSCLRAQCPRCRGRCLTFRVLVNKVLVKGKVRSQAVGSVSPCVPLTCRYLPRWWSHSCNLCNCPIEIHAFYASRMQTCRTALPFHISFPFFLNSLYHFNRVYDKNCFFARKSEFEIN